MEIFEDNRREHERARREIRAQKRKEARKNQILSSNNNTSAEGKQSQRSFETLQIKLIKQLRHSTTIQ
jgi:hypothetical protein